MRSRAGEDVAERLALAEVDAVIQTRVQGILIPSLVVAVLFAFVELAAALIGDAETLRLAVTSIVLAAGLYGIWALATGVIDILPIAGGLGRRRGSRRISWRGCSSTSSSWRGCAKRSPMPKGEPSTAGQIARYALKFSGRPSSWEGLAFRLADQIAPRMVRHAVTADRHGARAGWLRPGPITAFRSFPTSSARKPGSASGAPSSIRCGADRSVAGTRSAGGPDHGHEPLFALRSSC